MLKIKGIIVDSLLVLLVAVMTMLAIIWAPVLWGWQPLRVQSGSMEPTIRKDNIVYVRAVAPEKLRPGHIVAYRQPGFNLVTHRVVEVKDGHFYTRGDANNARDPVPVEPDWIIGQVVFQVPLGWR